MRVLLEAKKSYVRYISHELRTPLNAATLGLNMVVTQLKKNRHPTPDEAEMCETLSDIRLACSTAVDILNDLLSFEKLESGILVLHRENISVMKFMKEGIVMFSAQAKEKGVMLEVVSTIDEDKLKKFPSARPLRENDEFSCDRFKMDQVLRNLVSNAIKFSPQGGKVTLRIFFDDTPPTFDNDPTTDTKEKFPGGSLESVECVNSTRNLESLLVPNALQNNGEVRLGQLIIVVTDSGPGISEENQKKLFRGVIQFDPEKNQGGGGSGFGLFISKGIVDLHKGTITVFSEGEGHGCSFILAMPMVRATIDPIQREEERQGCLIIPTMPMPVNRVMSDPVIASSKIAGPSLAMSVPVSGRRSSKNEHNQRVSPRRNTKIAPSPVITTLYLDVVVPLPSTMSAAIPRKTYPGQEGDLRNIMTIAPTPVSPFNGRSVTSDSNLFRKKYRLLIVDDSGLTRKMLCKTMRVAGHECDEAEDGLVALNKVKEKLFMVGGVGSHMYDAVLMDTNMPNMDGPTAAKAMRDLGVTIPIFGVTGNGEEKDIEHYKSQGATAVFVKPFDVNHFVRHMKEIEFSKSRVIS